jgi:glyoxylase-like metal-dependent hydrolase (beta-lactamase superfamily II)/rhodanese-related sulfurtransferase
MLERLPGMAGRRKPGPMTTATESKGTVATRPVIEQTRVEGCLSYLVWDEESKEALVIDPRFDQVEAIVKRISEGGLKLVAAMDTHAHADHVSGVSRIAKETGAEAIQPNPVEFEARVVRDGDELKIGRWVMRVIATPGHTEESISLITGDVVFSGDALLIGGAGRTDFQNGSPETLFDTFEKKLRRLPAATVVYPGHDYKGRTHTTIGDELRANALFRNVDRSSFVERLKGGRQAEPANMRSNLMANRAGTIAAKTSLQAAELQARITSGERLALIDVRSPAEFAGSRLRGSRNYPLERIADAAREVPASQPVVLICATGLRSMMATGAFAGRGNVATLTGGLASWRGAGLPLEGAGGGVWALERQVRLVAGVFVLAGCILGFAVHPGFFAVPVFFGAGLTFAALTGTCGMGMLLAKLPFNRRAMSAPAEADAPLGGSCAAGGGGGCAVS